MPKGKRLKGLERLKRMDSFKITKCYSLQHCCLCNKDITMGQLYKTAGFNYCAHVGCLVSEFDKLFPEKTGKEEG
jgi:hypothetical protein